MNKLESQNNPQDILKQAIKLCNSNKYNKALDILKKIENNMQSKKEIYFIKGIIYQKQKKWNKAIKFFNQVIKLDHNHLHAHHHLAMIYEKLGKSSKSIKEWEHVLRLAKKKHFKDKAKKHIEVLRKKK